MILPENDSQASLLEKSRSLCDAITPEDDWLKREVLSHAGNRWSFGVIYVLNDNGRMRHAQIARQLEDVTQRMLTRTLRHLERDGLIHRFDHEEMPPRVEYELSELGHGLLQQMMPMWVWLMEHAEEFRGARGQYASQ